METTQPENSNTKATSDVLNNLELITEVLLCLGDDKKSLFSMALLSKAISAPALDHLWRSMDSLVPLFQLLPGVVRSEATKQLFCPNYTVSIPPCMKEYANRVQVVDIGPWINEISPHLCLLLTKRMAESDMKTLLPNLSVMNISTLKESFLTCLAVIITGSRLKTMKFGDTTPDSTTLATCTEAVLSQLVEETHATLEHLTIANLLHFRTTLTPHCVLVKLDELISLTAAVPNSHKILIVANSLLDAMSRQGLHTMDLRSQLQFPTPWPGEPLQLMFTSLKLACPASDIALLLARSTLPKLQNLSLLPTLAPDGDSGWIAALAKELTSAPRLKSIRLTYQPWMEHPASLHPIISSLPRLSSLSLLPYTQSSPDSLVPAHVANDFASNDSDFEDTLRAMSTGSLRSLEYLPNRNHLSLKAILLLSQLSPNLQPDIIHLAIDSSVNPWCLSTPGSNEPAPDSKLRRLQILDSRTAPFELKQYRSIAFHMAKRFPNLETLSLAEGASEASRASWIFIDQLRRDLS